MALTFPADLTMSKERIRWLGFDKYSKIVYGYTISTNIFNLFSYNVYANCVTLIKSFELKKSDNQKPEYRPS